MKIPAPSATVPASSGSRSGGLSASSGEPSSDFDSVMDRLFAAEPAPKKKESAKPTDGTDSEPRSSTDAPTSQELDPAASEVAGGLEDEREASPEPLPTPPVDFGVPEAEELDRMTEPQAPLVPKALPQDDEPVELLGPVALPPEESEVASKIAADEKVPFPNVVDRQETARFTLAPAPDAKVEAEPVQTPPRESKFVPTEAPIVTAPTAAPETRAEPVKADAPIPVPTDSRTTVATTESKPEPRNEAPVAAEPTVETSADLGGENASSSGDAEPETAPKLANPVNATGVANNTAPIDAPFVRAVGPLGSEIARTPDVAQSFKAVDVENVIEQIRVKTRPGVTRIQLLIDPPELGKVAIRLALRGDRLYGEVRVESIEVMQALKEQLPQLRHAMSEAGVEVEEFDLDLDLGQSKRDRDEESESRESREADSPRRDKAQRLLVETHRRGLRLGLGNSSTTDGLDLVV